MAEGGGHWKGGKFIRTKRGRTTTAEKNFLRTKTWGG